MKRTITGMTLILALVFAATAWSQESPMARGKMGMGKMEMETGKSTQMKACMQTMGKMGMGKMDKGEMNMEGMETKNAAVDQLVERMQAADGAEKMAAMEELLTVLVTQRREMHKMMPKMMCGGMMEMMMQ